MDPNIVDVEKYPSRRPFFVGVSVAVILTGGLLYLILKPSAPKSEGAKDSVADRSSASEVSTSSSMSDPSVSGRRIAESAPIVTAAVPVRAISPGQAASRVDAPVVAPVRASQKPPVRSVAPATPAAAAIAPAKGQQPPPPRPAPSADGLQQMRARVIALERNGDLLGARRACLDFLAASPGIPAYQRDAENLLGSLSTTLILSQRDMPEKTMYEIQQGDRLVKIAKKYGTTLDLLLIGNNIRDERLVQVGKKIRIFTGRFTLTVYKDSHSMVLWMNGEFCKRYSVGTGPGDKTPAGRYLVLAKQKNPTWWKKGEPPAPFGDPRNILGTRWMALKDAVDPEGDVRGLGIHGTADDSSIGKSLSAGCIRMHNSDVEELYALVPEGTPVTIQ